MIRHTLLPVPGKGTERHPLWRQLRHITSNAPAAGITPAGPADLAPLLITDPATVTNNKPATAGRAQRSLRQ
jgi:hypothetical protein